MIFTIVFAGESCDIYLKHSKFFKMPEENRCNINTVHQLTKRKSIATGYMKDRVICLGIYNAGRKEQLFTFLRPHPARTWIKQGHWRKTGRL